MRAVESISRNVAKAGLGVRPGSDGHNSARIGSGDTLAIEDSGSLEAWARIGVAFVVEIVIQYLGKHRGGSPCTVGP